MQILVCGGRYFDDKKAVWGCLDALHAKGRMTRLVHGACPVGHGGADMLADAWARDRKVDVLPVPINKWIDGDWPGCGTARNIRMWEDCKNYITGGVEFPGGNGTKHMVGLMRAAGIEVWRPLG